MGCFQMGLRPILTSLVCIGLATYFGYHLLKGDHGLEAHTELNSRVVALQGELAGLKAVRKRIERDVDLMRSSRLDPDMLDEQVRAVLNFAHPSDIVFLDSSSSTTASLTKP